MLQVIKNNLLNMFTFVSVMIFLLIILCLPFSLAAFFSNVLYLLLYIPMFTLANIVLDWVGY